MEVCGVVQRGLTRLNSPEPIHIPGAILLHGAMLVLDADTLEVLQAAGDTSRLLGVPLGELLGQSVATLFRPDQIQNLRGLAAALALVKPRHLLDPQLRVIAGQPNASEPPRFRAVTTRIFN
ncbi:hypothetical protein [Lichenifustis flavocetrariae]|uniref:PAS fold-2 domain-containing protein n=1 Tax=Lichenifustis flavocetrariae TaxID=2949735 RepID=A0AA41Z3C6_9HYPH|nr:hypothetical protein [Lichenifustis flavocetrariae]MCW6512969.1 hypothetical protein [Lichenifustis flavocetrariae]